MASKQISDEEILRVARARFKLGVEADALQKARELEALQVYGGDVWPADVRASRGFRPAEGLIPEVPARPCLNINKTREPVSQILNQERDNELQVEVVPADDFGGIVSPANQEEIELREGLIRRIQRETEATDARTWAYTRAVVAGRGYYAILTRYVPGANNWDQEVYYNRIYDQNSVVLDPAHEMPDGSDAEWAFIAADLPFDQYKAQWPKAANHSDNTVSDDEDEWRGLGSDAPGWFYQNNNDQKMVRVADYWYTEYTQKTLILLSDGSVVDKPQLDAVEQLGLTEVDRRTEVVRTICMVKMDGHQILERTEWPSPYIPIIKVVGNELPPFNGDRRVEGVVTPAIDSARGFVYMASRLVESVGLAPLPPWQVAEGQIEGYEQLYAMANTTPISVLPYKTRDLEGNVVGRPARTDMSTPIGAIAGALEMFAQSMQSTTGVSDPALGRNDPSLRSGVAIKRIQDQSHAGTSNYRDNYVRSLRHDARVLNSLLYPIYGIRPGRLTRMVTGEGEAKLAMIGAPPAGAQMPQTGAPQANGQPAEPPKVYTLTPEGARHNIAVKVSKNYDTRRQEEAAMNAELIQAIPSLMTIGGDLFFKSQDSPGAKQWAERMKTMLDPKVLAVINKQEGVQPPSPEVQAQMQQMQMQMQGMGQQLQEAQSQLQTDALKVQSDQAIAQFKAQTEKELAFLKAQTDKELLAMKLENDRIIAAAKLDREVVGSREAAEHAAQLQAQKAAADIERQLISQQSTGDEGI